MAEEVAIRVNNVSKSFRLPHERTTSVKSAFIKNFGSKRNYEVHQVLKDVSFEIKKGEFFGIVGRNGSGKSTLLKVLASIYQPTEGNIEISGKLVPFIELGVGFNPELTGRENVYLNGALLGFSSKEVRKMYKDIVDFAELERFMDQKLKNYSSGMQVRLAFSIAIRAHSDILLIDEVLAVGDADFQRKCYNYFHKLKKGRTTVIFVTHDMGAVVEYCDRAMLIDENKIKAIGSPEQIAADYRHIFNPAPIKAQLHNKRQKRWGDGDATITKVNLNYDENTVSLVVEAKFNRGLKDPVFGFVVKNTDGSYIFGTNSKVKNIDLKDSTKGELKVVEWSFPNILADGTFFLDVAIQHSDATTVCDWWEDAAEIEIKSSDGHVPYSINPKISLKVKD
jgi:ABC-2 type transport system ATP-binding protein